MNRKFIIPKRVDVRVGRLHGICHKSQVNSRIEVNKNLNRLKTQAREKLMSKHGLYDRSKRPIEVESVFGQLKSNNKFTRFTLRYLIGVG